MEKLDGRKVGPTAMEKPAFKLGGITGILSKPESR